MRKKKTLKIIVALIVVLILVWCSILTTDIIHPVYFNKKPVFASVDASTIQKDGGSALYNGFAYSIQTNINLLSDGPNINNIEVRIFNIFKFTIHGHNRL